MVTFYVFLTVLPEVTLESKKDFKNLREIRKGENVKLTCRAIGNPVTTYYVWRWENGTVIQNKSSGVLEFKNIQHHHGGRLSCVGGSYIGEGDKAYVNVNVRGKVIHTCAKNTIRVPNVLASRFVQD